jgi:hypothetical protein
MPVLEEASMNSRAAYEAFTEAVVWRHAWRAVYANPGQLY